MRHPMRQRRHREIRASPRRPCGLLLLLLLLLPLLLLLALPRGAVSTSPRVTSSTRFRLHSSAAAATAAATAAASGTRPRHHADEVLTETYAATASRMTPLFVETRAFGGNGLQVAGGGTGDSDALAALDNVCEHNAEIKAISTTAVSRADASSSSSSSSSSSGSAPSSGERSGRKFFTDLTAGMSRMQTVCVQFDVDLFELALAIASSGASLPTAKQLPFKTTVSFALNLEIEYGACKLNGEFCPMSVSAEGSIGVGVGFQLANLPGMVATAYISGSFDISSEEAPVCDPARHGGAAFMSPISFRCGGGWLLGTWFSNFFQRRLSTDPAFSARFYRDLITDRNNLEVELGAAQEEETIQALLSDVRLAKELYKENQDPVAVAKHPMYKKGAQFNYFHAHNFAPVLWAEAQLGEICLQRAFELAHGDEYAAIARSQSGPGKDHRGTIGARKQMRLMLTDQAPFPQHSKFPMQYREHVGLYPDPELPGGYADDSEGAPETTTKLDYAGQLVFEYVAKRSDRLRRVYKLPSKKSQLHDHAPTVQVFDFFKAKRPGCAWHDGPAARRDPSKSCYVVHPGNSKPGGNGRVAFGGAGGLFRTSDDLLTLERRFIWYVRWLLEIHVLKSFMWPTEGAAVAEQGDLNRPTRLDACRDLPVSFEDVVHHADKSSAGMQLAREWGMSSCYGKGDCDHDYRYIWNPRYWCHIGKNVLSKIPTTPVDCKADPESRNCIYLKRPTFDDEKIDKGRRPTKRYLYTRQIRPDPDPYPATGFDELFPDEYAIPRWSANVFPFVTEAAVSTMAALRQAGSVVQGIEIIQTFRTKLRSVVPRGGLEGDMGDVWGEEEDAENKVEEENRVEKGCPGEPLCVTSTFEALWRVVGTEAAAELSDRSKLTFGQRSAAIMPGLAYQLQAGYAARMRGNLKASSDKLKKYSDGVKLKSRLTYSVALAFGVTVGSSSVGFCTPDTNLFQAVLPALAWSGHFEPGTLGKQIKFLNPDYWAAEFFVFFPGIPVNLHVKRVGMVSSGPGVPYKYIISIKVRIKNKHPVGSFVNVMNGADGASWTAPAGMSNVPHFVSSALPTLAENLIPALLRIIYYAGDVIRNPDVGAKKGLKLLQKALGALLLPHGALLALGLGWFLPEPNAGGGIGFSSASVNALILSATMVPGELPKFGIKYAYTSIKELHVPVVPALTIKPAMLFGFRWDLGPWINANVLVKDVPKGVLTTRRVLDAIRGAAALDKDPFPADAFRTDRCNMCIQIFRKVIFDGGYTRYCTENGVKDELCKQVETAIKTFLDSNGSPGIWRHVIGGINRATKKSFEQTFGKKEGTQAERRLAFEKRCEQWPQDTGRASCLAQEFCLYSGVACHAKAQTEEDARAEAEHLIKEDVSAEIIEGAVDGDDVDGGGEDDVSDGETTPLPRATASKPARPVSIPLAERRDRVLSGKDDVDKSWLKWSPGDAVNLDPRRWSEWLRHHRAGKKKRRRPQPIVRSGLKGRVGR